MKTLQKALPALALTLSILCLLAALSTGLASRLEWWDFMMGFTVLKWSVYLTAVPVILVVVYGIWSKRSGDSAFTWQSILTVAICVCLFAVPYSARNEFMKNLTLADATTDFEDAPVFVALVNERAQTASNPLEFRGGDAMAKQQQFFPDLVTLQTSKSPAEVIEKATKIATQRGLAIAASVPEEGRLEATETTFWFQFKDDLVVRALAQEDGTTKVDIRSASRVGLLDGGVNAMRVEDFLRGINND